MENKMTELSAAMYNKAVYDNMTVSNAVAMLRQCTDFRTLSQKINAFSKGRDVKKVLIDGLCENHPDANRDTVSRKVRNWLNDCQNTLHKEDAVELCFVLGLTLDESENFVAMICEEFLHWRNLDEIPYIFALSKNMSYRQAVELHDRIKDTIAEDVSNNLSDDSFTDIVKNEIKNIENETELVNYIVNAKHRLGSLHNTAYELFSTMMNTLERPETELVDDDDYFPETENYSVGQIVQAYMHREDIPEFEDNKKKNLYSALQRSVLNNWPNETALSRIKNRHADVTRKVLILLFLATYDADNYISIDEENEDDYLYPEYGYEQSKDQTFKEFYTNMNILLESSGFKTLDPRAPFDWIVIFCMCVEDIYDIDGRFSDFLQTLFSAE